jgi:tetratricopeptide (TPR) repeat protein
VDRHALTTVQENWLHGAVVDAPNPGVVHIVQGFREIAADKIADGQSHWKIASQQYRASEFVINNLIGFVERKKDVEKYGDALVMVEAALELFPDQPFLYHTRGLIYFGRDRLDEARKDLELAVKDLPNNVIIREDLMKCYKEMKLPDLATTMEAEIDKLIAKLPEEERRRFEAARALEEQESK